MAFTKIETIQPSGRHALPASVTLRGSIYPRALVALTKAFCDQHLRREAVRYDALIGDGSDNGKLRLVDNPEGLITVKPLKGAMIFDLGHITALGTEPQSKRHTEARLISTGIVEITLPDFSAPADGGDEEDGDEESDEGGQQTMVNLTIGDVVVDHTLNEERVTFGSVYVEVSRRQAQLVALCKKALPSPCATEFLINALWDGRPPSTAATMLGQIAADTRNALVPLKLSIETIKGVGFKLTRL